MKFNSLISLLKIFMACGLIFCYVSISIAAPPDWIRSEDGLPVSTPAMSEPNIFEFGSNLYSLADNSLYVQLYNQPCFGWSPVWVPSGVTIFYPLEDYLFAKGTSLWWIAEGDAFESDNWNMVTSASIPAGASIHPKVIFGNYIYGVVTYFKSGSSFTTFDIYRSPDIGSTTMTWTKVVTEGFGDTQNHNLGYLGVFKNKLIAITTETHEGFFGDTNQYLDGIEVWESSSGASGSWVQVNEDG